MIKEYVRCPSCSGDLKRNSNNIDYDCYCPVCGQAIRISGNECFIRQEEDPDLQGISELRNELRHKINLKEWENALDIAHRVHNVTKDKNDWIITAECMFYEYMESTQLYHAYLTLFGILDSGIESIIQDESYYISELKNLQMFLGLKPFDEKQAYEYICSHKPVCVELNEYSSNFLRASIISAKCGRKNPELETDPRVIPLIKAFANSYGIKIQRGKKYKPLQIKRIKKRKSSITEKD